MVTRLLFPLAVLKDDGHQCVLEKTDDWNILELIVNGECVYKCNITDLEFGKLRCAFGNLCFLEDKRFDDHHEVFFVFLNSSLLIGGDGRLDPRCLEAIDAVRNAY